VSHKQALTQLFPLDMGPVFAADIEIEGNHLDALQAAADELQKEMHGHLSDKFLSSWERVLDITPPIPAPGEMGDDRRQEVARKIRHKGGLKKGYYVQLAAELGAEIAVKELRPFRAGASRVGEQLWKINARAGRMSAGDRLMERRLVIWVWRVYISVPDARLEKMIKDLRPAHTLVTVKYSS